jgi:hypothetical protein
VGPTLEVPLITDYTLSGQELEYVSACIDTAKLFGTVLHVRCDEDGLRVKVGDETWSLPMGRPKFAPGSGVIELPADDGPYDPRD